VTALDPPNDLQPGTRTGHRAAAILLVVGVVIWLAVDRADPARRGRAVQYWQGRAVLLVAAACLLPGVAARVAAALEPLRHPSVRARRWTMLAVALLSGLYLGLTAIQQHRPLFPKIHDENMYLLQARMLTEGRLWLPAHPLADFFETFHVITKDVYAPIYFPGTALAYAVGLLLHVPPWLVALAIAAAAAALLYRVTTELTDGALGLLAVLLLLSLTRFRHLSIMVMSHTLMLLLGLLMAWAYLRWRDRPGAGRALILGTIAGWAAITRPLDALCFAIPIAVAMLLDLRGKPFRLTMTTAACLIVAAAPFIALQLVLDYGVTGHVLRTPVTEYDTRNWPHLFTWSAGAFDPNFRPPTALQQVQDYYDQFIVKPVRDRNGLTLSQIVAQRGFMILGQTLPSLLLIVLLPAGFLALADRRRLVLWAVLPLFVIAYTSFIFFQKHYTLFAAPSVILMAVLGVKVARDALGARGPFWCAFPTLAVALLAVWALPQVGGAADDTDAHATLRDVDRRLADIRDPQAVVLFRYRTGDNFREEPVYNLDHARPDDARIVRAHDLGPARNVEIFNYYARLQPARVFYLYDRQAHTLTRLGTAAELADAKPK
jgi:hypothetical protein